MTQCSELPLCPHTINFMTHAVFIKSIRGIRTLLIIKFTCLFPLHGISLLGYRSHRRLISPHNFQFQGVYDFVNI